MNHEPTKPVLRWPGSKRRMLPILLPLVPADAHCYCEVFAGSAALLLAKPRHKVEIVNDLNREIVALLRNAHFHLPALLEEMHWMTAARADFDDFKAQPGLTEIQRAARFLMRNRTSFGAGMKSFAVSKRTNCGLDPDAVGAALEGVRRRLTKVVVENLPYERCLANYDSKETVFFMDPPYVDAPTGAYEGFTQADMTLLRSRIDRLQGTWILTVNDSKANRALFSDCRVRPVATPNHRRNHRTTTTATFGELVITPN